MGENRVICNEFTDHGRPVFRALRCPQAPISSFSFSSSSHSFVKVSEPQPRSESDRPRLSFQHRFFVCCSSSHLECRSVCVFGLELAMRTAMAAPGKGDSALQFLVMRTMARAAVIADADSAHPITQQYAFCLLFAFCLQPSPHVHFPATTHCFACHECPSPPAVAVPAHRAIVELATK